MTAEMFKCISFEYLGDVFTLIFEMCGVQILRRILSDYLGKEVLTDNESLYLIPSGSSSCRILDFLASPKFWPGFSLFTVIPCE